MMGSGGRGVPICFATFGGIAACLRFRTLNEIASPIIPTGTTRHPPSSGGNWNLSRYAMADAACLPQRNSLPSAHMR